MSDWQETTKMIKVRYIPYALITDPGLQKLVSLAINVRDNSQASYSGFTCGSAVESTDGEVFIGANVERVTFTQTTHAEQNAIDTMVSNHPMVHKKIRRLALAAAPKGIRIDITNPFMPTKPQSMNSFFSWCGQCLVDIWENRGGNNNIPIFVIRADGILFRTTIGDAYPMAFDADL